MKRTISHSLATALLALALALAFSFSTAWAAGPALSPDPTRVNTGPIPAETLAPLELTLNPGQVETLIASGELTLPYGDKPQTRLCPLPAEKPGLEASLASVKPSLGIETLIVVPLPAALAARADRDLVIYNILHSFRTMEGIEYFSQSRNAVHVFFTLSRLVKGPRDRSPLPDPVFDVIEPLHRYFLEQDDASFGRNLYDIAIRPVGNGGLSLDMQNLEQIWYGIVPVLVPRGLDMHVLVQPSADGKYLFFYGNAAMSAGSAFGLGEKVQVSYRNRITALYNWMVKRMAGA